MPTKKPSTATKRKTSKPTEAETKKAIASAKRAGKAVAKVWGGAALGSIKKPVPKKKAAAKRNPVARKAPQGEAKLRKLVKQCPHKANTARAKKWACLRNGQTGKEARAAIRAKGLLTPANYLRWLEANKMVKFA